MNSKSDVQLLRQKISNPNEFIVLPGVFDALSARITEVTGFDAIFQTGYGSAATVLGMPDYGFLNAGETMDNARKIIRAVDIPVIVDIDTGYGNPLTVWRIVKDLELMGASGVFLEDQIWPKRCGHMAGKEIIPVDEYLLKLTAAVEARDDNDFIVVARTDARATSGLDEAIERGREYFKSGADVVFVEAPRSIAELKEIGSKIDAPLVANMIEGGITPTLTASELRDLGFRIGVFPLSGLFASAFAMKQVYEELHRSGSTSKEKEKMITFEEFNKLVNLQKYIDLERKYAIR
ncbi:MAG TPA: oxaloacetate decarboxylase [Nitrososphaeraceae archaeon]|jgi:methylisocitrate lyase|nr:oxaloacetate decarboxylase [Nitrososphaeraceae archaeon]